MWLPVDSEIYSRAPGIFALSSMGMTKRLFLFAYLLAGCQTLFSQRMVEVKYEQDAKGAYVFSCINYAYCNYILDLGFTVFTNVKSDQPLPFHAEVKPGYTKLFTISAIDPQAATQIKFNSGSQKGCMHPVLNTDITYLFPISPGKTAQVYELSPDKSADSAAWYVLRLRMKAGDTVYASRKGVVNEIQDQDGANDAGQTTVNTENYIEIVQPDCSFARYGILKKNGAFVKPGQPVKAGQPIGIVGGDAYDRGSDIRFSVYYYSEDSKGRHYVIPLIWTKNNGKGKLKHGIVYTSEFPASVVNQEAPVQNNRKKKRVS
jgi:Peptidase family M23